MDEFYKLLYEFTIFFAYESHIKSRKFLNQGTFLLESMDISSSTSLIGFKYMQGIF